MRCYHLVSPCAVESLSTPGDTTATSITILPPSDPVLSRVHQLSQEKILRRQHVIHPAHSRPTSSSASLPHSKHSRFLQSISPCYIGHWPKYDSFYFLILFCSGMTGPISSRTDALLRNAVHGIRSILLQHHSSKASILLVSFFFMVRDSLPYNAIGNIIASNNLTFIDFGRSLPFHGLPHQLIATIPSNTLLRISS